MSILCFFAPNAAPCQGHVLCMYSPSHIFPPFLSLPRTSFQNSKLYSSGRVITDNLYQHRERAKEWYTSPHFYPEQFPKGNKRQSSDLKNCFAFPFRAPTEETDLWFAKDAPYLYQFKNYQDLAFSSFLCTQYSTGTESESSPLRYECRGERNSSSIHSVLIIKLSILSTRNAHYKSIAGGGN